MLAGRDPAEAFRSGDASVNHPNGHNRKQELTESGAMDREALRDGQGSFEPQTGGAVRAAAAELRRQGDLDSCARHRTTREDPRPHRGA